MSRLFDALKESVSSRQGNEGRAAQEVWASLGLEANMKRPAANDPDIAETVAAPASMADELALVLPDEQLGQVEPDLLNGSLATSTSIALDPKARLIPHAFSSVIAEHYRKLRTKIMQQQTEKPFRSLVVTSAAPQEGKTVTVLNLGLSFGMLPSFKVLVVDGDLRKGTLGNWMGVDDRTPGLSNLLDGSAQLDEVVLKSDVIPLHVMVRGNTQVLDLDASHFGSNFQRLAELYDLVLVDSPPVNLITDVQVLAESCDAVLLVARAFSTTQKAFEKAVRDLSRF